MNPNKKPWQDWHAHFTSQKDRSYPFVVAPYGLPTQQRAALMYSLARFQVGERGEGRIAHEIDRVVLTGIDSDYAAAIKLFVLEEGRHARILANMVMALGGRLLDDTWSDRLFRIGRRLMGIRLKLLVLLVAEVIGIGFYSFVKERLPAGSFRAALHEIISDEFHHLAFHTTFFHHILRGRLEKAVFWLAWWIVGTVACAVVLVDHAESLRTFRLSPIKAARRLFRLLAETQRRVATVGFTTRESVAFAF